jgi:hypothetical protein
LSDGNQVNRHVFLDLTSDSYGNLVESILGGGDPSAVVIKTADVIWGDGTNPQVLASYVDLTDAIWSGQPSSAWTYELVGVVDSGSIIFEDLIAETLGYAGDGSITKIIADPAGEYFAFESMATNYFDGDDPNYDNTRTIDLYVAATDGTDLQRISALPDERIYPDEDVLLLDYRRVGDEDQVLFETSEPVEFTYTQDDNDVTDLYLYRSGAAEKFELVSRSGTGDGVAFGFVSGQALFGQLSSNSGVIYVTESGALEGPTDDSKPDLVVFDTDNNTTTPISATLLNLYFGITKGSGFEISLQVLGVISYL